MIIGCPFLFIDALEFLSALLFNFQYFNLLVFDGVLVGVISWSCAFFCWFFFCHSSYSSGCPLTWIHSRVCDSQYGGTSFSTVPVAENGRHLFGVYLSLCEKVM